MKIIYTFLLILVLGVDATYAQITPHCTYISYMSNPPWTYTPSQIDDINDDVEDEFPNVVKLADPTWTYNCHNYAWVKHDGGSTFWLNSPGDDTFWSDGSYVPTSYPYEPNLRVSFQGDHSAVTTSTFGVCISKWGAWGLYQHATTDVPPGYLPQNTLTYYKKNPILGPDQLCSSETYSLANLPSGSSVSWSANLPYLVSLTPSGNTVQVDKLANGSITLTATVTTPCGSYTATKTVRVGIAGIAGINISNGVNQDQVFCTSSSANQFEVLSDDPSVTHSYQVRVLSYPNFNLVYTQNVSSGSFYPMYYSSSPGYFVLEIREVDPLCGTGEWMAYDVAYESCYMSRESAPQFKIFPNPSSSVLTVSSQVEQKSFAPGTGSKGIKAFDAKLYDDKARLMRQKVSMNGDDISFDIRDIPNGTYFLHILKDKQIVKKQVMIRH